MKSSAVSPAPAIHEPRVPAPTRMRGRGGAATVSGSESGFTFIEMVMVVVLLTTLVAIAVPVYQSQVLRSKETVLKYNLAIMRDRLDQYKADQGKYPTSLQELIDKGYLRELPDDPIMQNKEWEEVFEDYDPNEPDQEPGVFDVRSLSAEIGTDGRPYNEW